MIAETFKTFQSNTISVLQKARNADGFWTGKLSDSALATGVAICALRQYLHAPESNLTLDKRQEIEEAVNSAIMWLRKTRNPDGGWGDTPQSPSNLAATLLCRCAFSEDTSSDQWIQTRCGGQGTEVILSALRGIYGQDMTFSTPILATCALHGLLGKDGWQFVAQLPLELGAVPGIFFQWVKLPVVSYALPALVTIGLLRLEHDTETGVFHTIRKILRTLLIPVALRRVRKMQPESGGFLEAIPLTAFAVMSLSACGWGSHIIVKNGINFILRTQRECGTWPIDVNLSVWLSAHAAAAMFEHSSALENSQTAEWLMTNQQTKPHPFTAAAAGGWGWTHKSGAVPDADDTSAALLYLMQEKEHDSNRDTAIKHGLTWLVSLQNTDGGFPTFCKGRGELPFDASCPDITAHALQAILSVLTQQHQPKLLKRLTAAISSGLAYLESAQHGDGSWIPLWFGNQHGHRQQSPIIGTAFVLSRLAKMTQLCDRGLLPEQDDVAACWQKTISMLCAPADKFLRQSCRYDASWGDNGLDMATVEETALALSALCRMNPPKDDPLLHRGIACLQSMTDNGTVFTSAPVGLYFASLWYEEELYPIIFTLQAVNAYTCWQNESPSESERQNDCTNGRMQ